MIPTFNRTFLAYFLSLRDYSHSLTSQDRENFLKFAEQCDIYRKQLESSQIQTVLIELLKEKISENSELNQLFQTYETKLNQSGEIPSDLLPKLNNFYELEKSLKSESDKDSKSKIPNLPDDTTPEGQAEILNNFAIIISKSEEPENVTNTLTWIDKLKQWLN